MFSGRDQVSPQAGKDCAADVFRQAGIKPAPAEVAPGDNRTAGDVTVLAVFGPGEP